MRKFLFNIFLVLISFWSYGQNTITFSESFTNATVPSAAVETAWDNFRAQLTNDKFYISVTIKGSLDPIGVTCDNSTMVNQIAEALRLGNPGTWTGCNGREWRVGTCGGIELSAAGSICACPNPDYIVRPTIRNGNWGGAGTATCGGPSQTLTVVFVYGLKVTTDDATEIAHNGATLGGDVQDLISLGVNEKGVVYSSTDNTPMIGESGVTKEVYGTGVGTFSESITGLTLNTTYYFRAYGTSPQGTIYGEVKSFTTLACTPISVNVTPSTTVMFGTEVTLTGTSANGGTITWDNGITNGVAFVASATTTYNATSSNVNDCPVSQTITVQKAVQVSTQAATGITTTGATANGTIVDKGDPTPTQHGFCWNTTGTPTTADSKSELGAIATNSTFTSNLTGLTIGETYYVRAYATNVTGTYYGDEITFTTLKLNQTISFAALANKTYGDVAFDLTASATSTLPVTYASSDETVATISGSTVTIVGAGTTTITASQAGNATYYAAPVVERTLTVNKKELTVINAVVTAKVYNGNTDAAITGATLAGIVGADAVTLANATTGQFNNANVGNTKPVTHNMSLTGAASGNYTLTPPVLTGNITAKALTVSNAVVTTKVYDGNANATITGATLVGVVGADAVTLANATTGQFNNANVGNTKPVSHNMSITGAGTGNYSFTPPVLTGNITAKALTVSNAAVTTKIYDGNTNAAITGATLVGVVGAEAVTLANAATGTFNNANVGNTKPVSHNMSITGAASGNYTLTPPVLTGNITAKALTVSNAAVTTKVYDGNTNAIITGATLAGVVGADAVTLANAAAGQFNNANVGNTKPVTHTMSLTGAASGNYTLTPPVLTGNITAKELTVADAVVTTKVYDGNTDAAITGATLTGVVGADDVILSDADAGSFNNANAGTDKPVTTAMTISGAGTSNYTLTQPVIAGDITAKELTVADAVVTTKVYDGTAIAEITGATLTGVVGVDDVTLDNAIAGMFDNANVGADKPVTHTMSISGAGTGNYTFTPPVLTGDITAKELTVADAVVTPKVYDGNTDAAVTGATLTGVVGTDAVILGDTDTGTFDNANVGIDKHVTTAMTITGAAAGNYTLTQPVITGDITAKELTVTDAVVTTKVYDGMLDAEITGAMLTGVVGADDVMLIGASLGQFDTQYVGAEKSVTTSMELSGTGKTNYTLTQPVLTGDITPKELTVANAVVTTKIYDGNSVAEITGAELQGVVGAMEKAPDADDVTLSAANTGQFDDASVGTGKPVSTSMILMGADIDNYYLTQPTLTGDITAKELTVADAVVTTKVYDGNTDAAITGATLAGVIGTDDVTLGDADAGTFNDANVGTDKPVTTAMIISGAATGNYTLTQPVIAGDITAKELTVADAIVTTKVYDGNADAIITGATLTGVVGADDVTLANGTAGQFDDANVGADKPVTHTMDIIGTGTGNYTFAPPVLTGDITVKELTVTDAVVTTKIYDGNTDAEITGATLAGVVGTDDVTLGNTTAGTFDDANVGTDKPVTTAMTITGAGTGNYTLTQPVITGDITAKELTITGTFEVEDKNYDGTTDATIIVNNLSLNGLVAADAVDLMPIAAFDSPDIGSNILVSLTGATAISGASASNYVLSHTGAPTTTASILDPTINVDMLAGSGFIMYPNPVSNMLTVETGTSEVLKIRLLSITGQEVFAGEITNKMQIDTSSLHPGIYFIAIIDGAQQTIHKLIKK
jgi:hypothetical protein